MNATPIAGEARITLTIGETKLDLTMEEAKALLQTLQKLVQPVVVQPAPAVSKPQIPFPWDRIAEKPERIPRPPMTWDTPRLVSALPPRRQLWEMSEREQQFYAVATSFP